VICVKMASYFDDHNCEPLAMGQTPDHHLQFMRYVATAGAWDELGLRYEDLYGETLPPPTSARVLEELPCREVAEGEPLASCSICLKPYAPGEKVSSLPCAHSFHAACVLPWLKKTSTCPMCRRELPTDNVEYEEYKAHKKRQKERESQLEMLHDSMFS